MPSCQRKSQVVGGSKFLPYRHSTRQPTRIYTHSPKTFIPACRKAALGLGRGEAGRSTSFYPQDSNQPRKRASAASMLRWSRKLNPAIHEKGMILTSDDGSGERAWSVTQCTVGGLSISGCASGHLGLVTRIESEYSRGSGVLALQKSLFVVRASSMSATDRWRSEMTAVAVD